MIQKYSEQIWNYILSVDVEFVIIVAAMLSILIASRFVEDDKDVDNEYDAFWDDKN